MARRSAQEMVNFANQAVQKTLVKIGGPHDPRLGSTLNELSKQLSKKYFKIGYENLKGYHVLIKPYPPKRIFPNFIYLYIRNNKLEYTYIDQDGEIRRVSPNNLPRLTEKVKKQVASQSYQLSASDNAAILKIFKINDCYIEELKDPESLRTRMTQFNQAELLADLKKTLADYLTEVEVNRDRLGNLFRNQQQTQMRINVLSNLLNYLERRAKENLSYLDFQKLIAKEVAQTLKYIEMDHQYGSRTLNVSLFQGSSKAAYLLRQFQKQHSLADAVVADTSELKLLINESTTADQLRNQLVDHLRSIKQVYYNRHDAKANLKHQFDICYLLENMIKHFMRHSLETLDDNKIRTWNQVEFCRETTKYFEDEIKKYSDRYKGKGLERQKLNNFIFKKLQKCLQEYRAKYAEIQAPLFSLRSYRYN